MVFLVLVLQTGPKMAQPASSQATSCSCGHMPASRLPLYSSWPWKPSTISDDMPISTGRPVSLATCSVVLSTAWNSASPVDATVS